MKESRFFAIIIWIILSLALAGVSIGADRGIKVKQIGDLTHESGKLGEYKALIIGINDYKGAKISDLETPINDATAIAKVLREKYGFKVKLLLDRDATKEAIYRALRRLAASTKLNDSVLIYFAGHGDFDRTYDDGWWIPADAVGGNPVTYLDNIQVQKAMRSMKARHVLLISDSCYSGTLFGKARSLPPVIDDKYYLSLFNEKSRWGMTSGNKTPVSDQGTGGHSVFAYQLIKELEKNDKPFLSTQEIYTRIAPVIANNSEQTPLCRPIVSTGDQGGEFVFVASVKNEPPPTVSKSQQSPIDKETVFWQSIEDSEDPALFEAYLKAFPNGVFAPIAKQKIAAFKEKEVIASIPTRISKSRLFVEVEPKDSRIRILNIKPKFQQGMELASGRYHMETSKQGYETKKTWVELRAGEDKKVEVNLEKVTASVQPTVTNISRPTSSTSSESSSHNFNNHSFDEYAYQKTLKKLKDKQIEVSGIPKNNSYPKPSSSSSNVVKRDGQYLAYANGIVKDTKTGLEWKVGPDKNTSWNEARSWVQSLNFDGDGWRMPSMDELKGLYNKGAGDRNRTSLLKTTGWGAWSSETDGSSRARLFLFSEGRRIWGLCSGAGSVRAFAVRSRKGG